MPSRGPCPGCGVDLKSCLERFSVFARQECPGDRKVAGWVTNSHTSEIDHGAQPATADKEVQRRQKRQLDGRAVRGILLQPFDDAGGVLVRWKDGIEDVLDCRAVEHKRHPLIESHSGDLKGGERHCVPQH